MQPVAFMHIPKAAGTSMLAALSSALRPACLVTGFDHFLFGTFSEFERLGDAARARIFASSRLMPPSADLVAGHFARSTLRAAYPTARFLTILREPLGRLLSHWLFWRSTDDEHLVGWEGWADRVRLALLPLADFLAEPSIACQTDNLATRALLWPHRLIPADGFIDPGHDGQLLDEAMAFLRQFDFVDVIENPDLERRLGDWLARPFALPRLNQTLAMKPALRSSPAREITSETRRLLAVRSRLDLALWSATASRTMAGVSTTALQARLVADGLARTAGLLAG